MAASASLLPRWKKALLGLGVALVVLALLEGALRMAGVGSALQDEDPFVGFASGVPLFVADTDPAGQAMLRTADNKRLFNRQQFPRRKAPGTVRIFCVGGSTTFGRPFDDRSSFCGWLRELLPRVAPSRQWEVINAGGVSYASYRVARLMDELAQYEPDLFVVYTGQNEFLEERTYRNLRSIPGPVRAVSAALARTGLWSAMRSGLENAGVVPERAGSQLAEEADTLLEHFGPQVYERDDRLRAQILEHFEVSLQRMVSIADRAGARIIFVSPASNLRDCSPFKSEHGEGLPPEVALRTQELLASARGHIQAEAWDAALLDLDSAISLDPRFAELHYRRGKVLLALGRTEEARAALLAALEEDVCPLRALPAMGTILAKLAAETDVPLIDYPALLARHTEARLGHGIVGNETFLDHVHPTVEAHGLLARRLAEEILTQEGLAPAPEARDAALTEVAALVQERLDPATRARSLSNLAQVLAWSGKIEDAVRPAQQAMELGGVDPATVAPAASILATWYAQQGDDAQERRYYAQALKAQPRNADLHWRLGLRALDRDPPEPLRAASHIFLASVYWQGAQRDAPHRALAGILADQGCWPAAYSHLLEARTIAPGHPETRGRMAKAEAALGPAAAAVASPRITVDHHPSGDIQRLVQVRVDGAGRAVPEGVWTEWHEGGMPARYRVVRGGQAQGVEITWDPAGQVLSSVQH